MTHNRVYKIINLCGSCQEAAKKIGSNLVGVDYFLAYLLMWLNKIYTFQLVDNYIKILLIILCKETVNTYQEDCIKFQDGCIMIYNGI